MSQSISVVMTGASGAAGNEVVAGLKTLPAIKRVSLLGRRSVSAHDGAGIEQHVVDVLGPASYRAHLAGHDCAICTLGVAQPSEMSRDEFVRIDKDAGAVNWRSTIASSSSQQKIFLNHVSVA